jgi:hypothetical protein
MRRTALAALLALALPSTAAWAASFPELAPPAAAIAWRLVPAASDAAGLEGLGSLDRIFPNGWARRDAGGDGKVTDVRSVYDASRRYRLFEQVGFLWTQPLGLVFLGVWNARGIASDGSTLVGAGVPSSAAFAISPDDSTVVGFAESARGIAEMEWTAAAAIVAVGDPPMAGPRTAGERAATPDAPPGTWASIVPEPAPGSLAALGLAGLARRRRSA